jgi:hypothetical protein
VRRIVVALASAVALLTGSSMALMGIVAEPAAALTTFTVDNPGDHTGLGNPGACMPSAGSCMLRDAVAAANLPASGDAQINVPASLGPITLTSGNVLSYTGSSGGTHLLTITGVGAKATVSQNAGATQAVITDSSTGLLTIQSLTVTGGNSVGGSSGGGINAVGDVTVMDSTIANNHTDFIGGGLLTPGGNVTLTNSAVTGNTAALGAGGLSGGIVTIVRSLVANNTSAILGGGIDVSTAIIVNSTISNNTGGQGGGIDSNLPITLAYATVVDNTAPSGANIFVSGNPSSSFASVIALPHGSVNCALGGTTNTLGYNFSDDSSCGFNGATDKQSAGDPMLGLLAANGGPTLTRLPSPASPLIDAIPNASCQTAPLATGITNDQRAFPRPSPAAGACDIGAVEIQVTIAAAPVVITPRFTG